MKKTVLLFFIACFALYVVFNLKGAFGKLNDYTKHNTAPFPKITNTYAEIFSDEGLRLLNPSYTFYNKFRHPISTFKAKDDLYNLVVYKVDSIPIVSNLKDFIKIEWRSDIKPQSEIIYDGSTKTEFIRVYNASHKPTVPKTIYMKIDGSQIGKPVIRDSLMIINLHFEGLSGQYSSEGDVEFFAEKSGILNDVEATVAFLRRKDIIYMLILCSGHTAPINFDHSLLQRLIVER
jgi:hypothetical protein